MKKLFCFIVILVLGGCTMAPKYERPAAPISQDWPINPNATNSTSVAPADVDWRTFFNDPRLQRLIELSLTNNRDFRIAALRVEQSRALYRIRRADLIPRLDANASWNKQHFAGGASGFDNAFTLETYQVSLNAAWEVDLFGRVRSLK